MHIFRKVSLRFLFNLIKLVPNLTHFELFFSKWVIFFKVCCHTFPSTRTSNPGVMKFLNQVEPSQVMVTLYFVCLNYAWVQKEIMHFHHISYIALSKHMNPCPWGHEIYYFSRLFIGHHYNILSFSDICPGLEKKIFYEILHFHHMIYIYYLAKPQHNNSCPMGH